MERPPVSPIAGIEAGVVANVSSFVGNALGEPLLHSWDLDLGRVDHEVHSPLTPITPAAAAMNEMFVEHNDIAGTCLDGDAGTFGSAGQFVSAIQVRAGHHPQGTGRGS
jgi:hypothetical protein